MMYGGGGGEEVYGVEVSYNAAEPAKKFMHAQFAWCGCATCFSVTALFFTLAAVGKYEELKDGMFDKIPTAQANNVKFIFQDDLGEKMKWAAIQQIVTTLLVGCCVVGIARKFLEDRNVKCCCIWDSVCSCIYCLNGLSFCGATVFFFMIVGATKYPTKICMTVQQEVAAGNAGVTQQTTIAPIVAGAVAAETTSPLPNTEGTCIQAVGLLKDLATLYGIFMMIATCVACSLSSICGAGAAAAKELNEIFEDEESGSAYGQPGGYY